MLPAFYSLIVILSLVASFLILKKTGAIGILIILAYLIISIPDHLLMKALTDVYLDNEMSDVTSWVIWVEVGVPLRMLFSLALLSFGFYLLKKKQKADPVAVRQ